MKKCIECGRLIENREVDIFETSSMSEKLCYRCSLKLMHHRSGRVEVDTGFNKKILKRRILFDKLMDLITAERLKRREFREGECKYRKL